MSSSTHGRAAQGGGGPVDTGVRQHHRRVPGGPDLLGERALKRAKWGSGAKGLLRQCDLNPPAVPSRLPIGLSLVDEHPVRHRNHFCAEGAAREHVAQHPRIRWMLLPLAGQRGEAAGGKDPKTGPWLFCTPTGVG